MADRVLIADAPSTWRDQIVRGITEAQQTAEVTQSGQALLDALGERPPTRNTIVVGDGLDELSGVDALYRAQERLRRDKESKRGDNARVLLVTNVRFDLEWLDLMRKRGVTGFLHRDVDVELSVEVIARSSRADRRDDQRLHIGLETEITYGGRKVSGVLEDVSLRGAKVVIPRKELRELATGDVVTVGFPAVGFDTPQSCRAEVRRLATRKRILGDRAVVGLRFLEPNKAEATVKALSALMKSVVPRPTR